MVNVLAEQGMQHKYEEPDSRLFAVPGVQSRYFSSTNASNAHIRSVVCANERSERSTAFCGCCNALAWHGGSLVLLCLWGSSRRNSPLGINLCPHAALRQPI